MLPRGIPSSQDEDQGVGRNDQFSFTRSSSKLIPVIDTGLLAIECII